jgi:type I restriction enzyme S subunit
MELPDSWTMVKLGDLGEVNRGRSRHRPRYAEHLYGGPYPFIQTGDIKASGGRISDYTQTYSEAGLAQSRLWPAGTMCITIAANIAETAILSFPACFPDSVVGFIPDGSKCDVYFIEYMFRFLRSRVQHEASGSVQDNINLQTLDRLRFPLPPLDEQKAIAHILGTLDDKIELNRQMNETLEAMARAIFKSWFVDFDPVRARAEGRQPFGMDAATAAPFPDSFQDSPVGKIPKGWKSVALPEAVEVNPPRSISSGQVTSYLDMQNMPTRGHRPTGWVMRAFVSGSRFVNGDTLLARITPCLENRKTAFVDFLGEGEVGWGSTEFIVLRPKDPMPPEYGYCLARDEDFRSHAIQNMTGSSGRQRVPTDSLSQFTVAVPTEAVARSFGKIVRPLFGRAKTNSEESATLAAIRDALLPKLISGEIRVKGAVTEAGETR